MATGLLLAAVSIGLLGLGWLVLAKLVERQPEKVGRVAWLAERPQARSVRRRLARRRGDQLVSHEDAAVEADQPWFV
jgi:hypothetical protein